MRTIKFRAVNEKNNKFEYGMLIYDMVDNQPCIQKDLQLFACIKGTEGQFTGKLDYKGNDIYEGDILMKSGERTAYKVFFDDDWSSFMAKVYVYGVDGEQEELLLWEPDLSECVIVGNIHDIKKS